ncbi:hypothetical protein LS73_000350 [Helicobacter muridarum]|uniref:Phosphoribose diphosphate:decaprenyl-phosphate phosphoribosyltransferase n=1 Tax=Helicobacter muridarum TaxID=216 RepID=A0A377PTT7_9HELI|nr:hypothetical protein [Helicobacter muridarum]TLE01629.1 hypothetical protein LS73_000350 [Helicobacter muridarum]STQ86246.1 phosphoribose diphosphate:decaprenyl-phosphate phosphoribosyltransferase [Helicobacter muridarum]
MRLFVGSFAVKIELSHYIIIITFCLCLFLALGKRRSEYKSSLDTARANLKSYNIAFFDCSLSILGGTIVLAYILYSIEPSVVNRMQTNYLYLTGFFVLIGILRYLQLIFVFDKAEDPSMVVLSDRFLQIVICLWTLSFFVLLYL